MWIALTAPLMIVGALLLMPAVETWATQPSRPKKVT